MIKYVAQVATKKLKAFVKHPGRYDNNEIVHHLNESSQDPGHYTLYLDHLFTCSSDSQCRHIFSQNYLHKSLARVYQCYLDLSDNSKTPSLLYGSHRTSNAGWIQRKYQVQRYVSFLCLGEQLYSKIGKKDSNL